MKQLILGSALLFVIFAGIAITGQSFGPPPPPSPQKLVFKNFAVDTITNTEADTILLSSAVSDVQSLYTYSWHVSRTNLSGTTNVALKVEERIPTSGTTGWVTVNKGSGTGATAERLTGTELLGRQQRLILTGSGTQSSSYLVSVCLKLKQ